MAAGNRLDFAYSFEDKLESDAADVLSGMAYVYINMDTRFIVDMARCAIAVIQEICPGSRALASAYQDATTMGLRVYTLNIQFHVLTKKPADCQKLVRLTITQGAEIVGKLFELQMARDENLEVVDVKGLKLRNEFAVHLNYPLFDLRSVQYPASMLSLPEATATQTLSEAGAKGRNISLELGADADAGLIDIGSCTLVGAPCVCVSLKPKCSWGTSGTIGRCVNTDSPGVGFTVTNDCLVCPLASCSSGAPQQCPGFFTPCSCANSQYNCAWNRTASKCQGKEDNALTPCDLCAKQTHCSPPATDLFFPGQSSFPLDQFNASFNKEVRLTGLGSVRIKCTGDSVARIVPSAGVRVFSGSDGHQNMLYINARLVRNPTQSRCDVLIDEGALISNDNISFLGLPCPQSCGFAPSYSFVFKDNYGPDFISMIPRSGTSEVKDTVLQVTFNEELQYSPVFVVRLLVESTGEVVAEFRQGPQVTLELFTLKVDVAGTFKPAIGYALEIPKESLQDLAGNMLVRALGNNAFTFTFAQSENKVKFEEEGLSPLIIGLIVGGVALVICGICGFFIYWSQHMSPVRSFIGRRLSRMSVRGRISVSPWGNQTRQSTFKFRMSTAFKLTRGHVAQAAGA
eukprot:TRINITY_DN23300_c0_g3_i3.p1 TRINITY_DN23300_c0_g3~~TRINITY_DN23300_c0_g3_i3.p1  ORF type:complete len:661 (-),score=84.45 TRINITY_DN23300_c0_g3_i3:228-2114(-)